MVTVTVRVRVRPFLAILLGYLLVKLALEHSVVRCGGCTPGVSPVTSVSVLQAGWVCEGHRGVWVWKQYVEAGNCLDSMVATRPGVFVMLVSVSSSISSAQDKLTSPFYIVGV